MRAILALVMPLTRQVLVNVGSGLSRGDLALESHTHFSAVAQHRLIPPRAGNVTAQLRQAGGGTCRSQGGQSAWSPRLSLPSIFTPSLKSFSDSAVPRRLFCPWATGSIAHLFVLDGYQGVESEPQKLTLTEQLLAHVLVLFWSAI